MEENPPQYFKYSLVFYDYMVRTNMMRNIALVIVLGILLLGCKPQEDVVTVGAVGPYTGVVAFFGQYMKEGYELALEEINAEGGINGKELRILYEDDGCDVKKTQSALLKLIDIDKPAMILGPFCGTNSVVAAKLAGEKKQFIIAPGDNFGKISDYYFSVRYPIFLEGQKSAELAHDVGIKKAGIIYFLNDWGETLRKDFTETFEQLGGEITIAEGVDLEIQDFRTSLLKIKNSGADGIFVSAWSGPIYKAMKELHLDLVKVGSFEVESDDTLRQAGDAANGVVYAYPGLSDAEKTEVQLEFLRKFEEKYDHRPDPVAHDAYDAMKITADALRACDPEFTSECIRDFVKSIKDYQGASGPLTFNEDLWAFEKPFSRRMIKDEKFVDFSDKGDIVVIS